MALARLTLDTRSNSKRKDGTYPIALRVFHKTPRYVTFKYATSIDGWDEKNTRLRRSSYANRNKDCDEIESEIEDKLILAKKTIKNFGDDIDKIDVKNLIAAIKLAWDKQIDTPERKSIANGITLLEWGNVLINRKRKSNSPATGEWYANSISTLLRINGTKDIRLDDIAISLFKELEIDYKSKNKKTSSVNTYLRGIRAIYNKAIEEDKFTPSKNPFDKYKIPSASKTKKRANKKENFLKIRNLKYPRFSTLWHTKNYILVMFNCRGMNLIDLVKLKAENIEGERLYYGRSKTGDPLSVGITKELRKILNIYTFGKGKEEYLFPSNYDGSTQNYEKYKSIRRRVNERMKIIATDAGIEGKFTTYTIRHSWATIAKYMGVSTEIISEGLGHHSLKTTEIYLKGFENKILDDANEKIVA